MNHIQYQNFLSKKISYLAGMKRKTFEVGHRDPYKETTLQVTIVVGLGPKAIVLAEGYNKVKEIGHEY